MKSGARWVVVLFAVALLAAACSESGSGDGSSNSAASTTAPAGPASTVAGDGRTVLSKFAGQTWFKGPIPEPSAADQSKPPLRVGMINADAGAIATLPELRGASEAAAKFINTELGGVGGRPIELVGCSVDISPEQSQLCARKMVDEKVVAVLAGIDVASGAAIKVLNDAGIPWIGGIPLNFDEMSSKLTFQFSGGTPGAFTAFAHYATETLKAKKAAVVYVDLAQVKSAAVDYGVALLEKKGVQVTQVPFAITTQDYAAIIQRAVQDQPDVLIVGAADFACPKALQAVADLKVTATVMMVGSCADAKWLQQVGIDKAKGTIFNVEGRLDLKGVDAVDQAIYTDAMTRYGAGTNAVGAATVGFRGAMNLWSVLSGMTTEITPGSIADAFRAAGNRPSFNGHPFTCDGRQVPALPGLCAPQQVLGRLTDVNVLEEVSDGWVEVPQILSAAGIGQS